MQMVILFQKKKSNDGSHTDYENTNELLQQ